MTLDCSVGVGRSKLMAKLASKAAKPRASRSGSSPGPGWSRCRPTEELDFLHPLPGPRPVGHRPRDREAAPGARGHDGRRAGRRCRPRRSSGTWAWRRAGTCPNCPGGSTTGPVVPEQEAKSIGHEETFSTDLWDLDDLHRRLQRMVDASATALRRAERAARTVTVKLRFGDFTQMTRSHTLDGPVDATPAIGAVAAALLESVDLDPGVRLLGVSLSGLVDPGAGTQLRLDLEAPAVGADPGGRLARTATEPDGASPGPGAVRDASREAERLQQSWGSVTTAVDAIRARYGGRRWARRRWSPRRGSRCASGARPSGDRPVRTGTWAGTHPGGRPGWLLGRVRSLVPRPTRGCPGPVRRGRLGRTSQET